jgi:hypothetical protein
VSWLVRRRYGTPLRLPEREPRHVSHWKQCEVSQNRAFRAMGTFLYVLKPGRHGPDAPPLHPASARSRSAPRARRAARARHASPDVEVVAVASGRGRHGSCGVAPQRQARCASRSHQPLRRFDRWVLIITVASGSDSEGLVGSGVNG